MMASRLGTVLKRARERLGLSQRALAERMDISWVAVSHAENGADVTHRSLRGFLKALPGLTPHELLRGSQQPASLEREQVWTYYRDLIGVESASIERELTMHANGERETSFRCRNLRSVRGRPSTLRLLHGLESVAYQSDRELLAELRAERRGGGDDDLVRSRVLEKREGRFLHQLTVPPDLVRSGLSYSWTRVSEGVSPWREDSPAYVPGKVTRIHSGQGHRVTEPTRRLVVRVSFFEGYWPDTIYLRVWPSAAVPDPRVRDFTADVHPEGLKLRKDKRRGLVSLTVDYPLVDWSYNIGWIRPSRPGA